MTHQTIENLQTNIEQALKSLPRLADLPSELQALRHLVPTGSLPKVSLRYRDDNRKIRRNASADHWKAGSCQAVITYEKEGQAARQQAPIHSPTSEEERNRVGTRPAQDDAKIQELLMALQRAESEPRLRFVGLKWFRDEFLPSQASAWALDRHERSHILQLAIDRGFILTDKVRNSKPMAYPTTAVRLNRTHPEIVKRSAS